MVTAAFQYWTVNKILDKGANKQNKTSSFGGGEGRIRLIED